MLLKKGDYETLYEELMLINYENYIKENNEDEAIMSGITLNISWEGAGLYYFCGLGFINEYLLCNIVNLFELQTEVSHKIYLGCQTEIEKAKNKFTNGKNAYVVWGVNPINRAYTFEEIIEDENPLDTIEVYSELSKGKGNIAIESIKEMDSMTFYEFLKQYYKSLNF